MEDSPNPKWALGHAVLAARIPPNAKLIMLVLLDLTNGPLDISSWSPSTRKLAELTSLKRDTVVKYIALLELHGWLAVRRHAGDRNQYVLSAGRAFAAGPNKGTTTSPHNGTTAGPNKGTTTSPHNGTTTRPARPGLDQLDKERFFLAELNGSSQVRNGFDKPPLPLPPRPLAGVDLDALTDGLEL